jgi:hypothetical protein
MPEKQKNEISTIKKDSVLIQECFYTDLSNTFDYKIHFKRMFNVDGIHDSCIVQLNIIDKKTHIQVDSLIVYSTFLYGIVFQNCNNARSYITGKNEHKEVADNDYGELIIADYNFDSREDIALIRDSGGNGGPVYNFYIQGDNNKFLLDKYLTDSMEFFPSEFNKKKRSLVIYVHAGACWIGEHKYHINKKTGQWKQLSHKLINVCE